MDFCATAAASLWASLKRGEPGNEHFDISVPIVASFFYDYARWIDEVAYVETLQLVRDQCCCHGDNAVCNETRCSLYVYRFVCFELEHRPCYRSLCQWRELAQLHERLQHMSVGDVDEVKG